MKYTLTPFHGEWAVEILDEDGEGELHIAMFSGPEAKARAFENASWKMTHDRQPIQLDGASIRVKLSGGSVE